MKPAIKKSTLLLGLMLFISFWGVFPACASDGGYCTWKSGVITLKQNEVTGTDFGHLGGCTLKYVLIRPSNPSECSKIYTEYTKEKGAIHTEATNYETTSVCGSASSDAAFKFSGSLSYAPVSVRFTCRSATCTLSYGLTWYE